MSIYSLKHGYYLYHDVDFVLNQIGELYEVNTKNDEILVSSKLLLDGKHHFASKESADVFNNIIPQIKGLHIGMYHLLESIYRATGNGLFQASLMERRFPDFKYFRLLNNKIKHFNDADIDFIQIVVMDGSTQVIDVGCQYKIDNHWELKYHKQFVLLFLTLLKELDIITFNES